MPSQTNHHGVIHHHSEPDTRGSSHDEYHLECQRRSQTKRSPRMLVGCPANQRSPTTAPCGTACSVTPVQPWRRHGFGVKQGATGNTDLSDAWPGGQLLAGGGLFEDFENMSIESLDSIILRLKDGIP